MIYLIGNSSSPAVFLRPEQVFSTLKLISRLISNNQEIVSLQLIRITPQLVLDPDIRTSYWKYSPPATIT